MWVKNFLYTVRNNQNDNEQQKRDNIENLLKISASTDKEQQKTKKKNYKRKKLYEIM